MKFQEYKLSKRYPPILASIIVYHEPSRVDPVDLKSALTPYRSTAAAIVAPDGRAWVGVTACSPADAFVRSVGRDKAIGRAFGHVGHQPDELFDLSNEKAIAIIVRRLKELVSFYKAQLVDHQGNH